MVPPTTRPTVGAEHPDPGRPARPGGTERWAGEASWAGEAFGVYVHVPFCAHRCDYCDFATWSDRAHLVDAYVEACLADLGRRRAEPDVRPATSVFFGGGTPSLLAAEHLARLLAAVERAPGAEVTVECNPDSVDVAKLAAYRAAGVTRISLGVQSFDPAVLGDLGRTHEPDNVRRAVAAAHEVGFDDVNLDLIAGTPGESPQSWAATVEDALALEPTHISAYALTVEPATPLGRRIAAGAAPAPDDDDQAEKYGLADDRLRAAGFEWYEVSNWARPGRECRHNLLYWSGGDYLAVGCAAHGHTAGRRWWNVRTPERYLERIAAGESPEAGSEVLDAGTRAEEVFALALRTRTGVRVAGRAAREVRELGAAGLVVTTDADRVVLTRRGRLLGSDVTARLLLAGAVVDGGEAADPAGTMGRPLEAGTR